MTSSTIDQIAIFGAEGNTLNETYRYYYKHGLRNVHITSNLTQDKKLALSIADESSKRMKHLLRLNILTLDEYLRHIPSDLYVNIEIQRYGGKQNSLCNAIICRYIMAMKKRGKKNVTYSSSDREIARIVLCNRRDGWFIMNTKEALETSDISIFPKVCIHKSLIEDVLESFDKFKDKEVYVTGLTCHEELELFKNNPRYSFVKGYIVKLDE